MIDKIDFIRNATEGSNINLDDLTKKTEGIASSLKIPERLSLDFFENLNQLIGVAPSKSKELGEALFNSRSVLDFTHEIKVAGYDTLDYISAFIDAASRKQEELNSFGKDDLDIQSLCSIANPSHHEFRSLLVRYKVRSWLAAIGLDKGISYDHIHKMAAYNFTHKKDPNLFAQNISDGITGENGNRIHPVKGKDVLSLGSGNAMDEKLFLEKGAQSVKIIENSEYALSLIQKTRDSINGNLSKKLVAPAYPKEMFNSLQDMIRDNERVDTVYCHSSTHYFDDSRLKELSELIKDCLSDGGYFAFAVKAPGATLDSNGIPLLIDDQRVIRGYLNNDTHARFFRDKKSLVDLICSTDKSDMSYFEIESVEDLSLKNYDTSGEQDFYGMVFKKVVNKNGY